MLVVSKGDFKNPVEQLELVHRGQDLHFRKFMSSLVYKNFPELEETQTAKIVFEDSYEIDALIDMLKELKRITMECVSTWQKTDF